MSSEKIKVKPIWKTPTGHQNYSGGGGKHADRRLKRLKTRNSKNKKAIEDAS